MVRAMELGGPTTPIQVGDAITRFLADAAARKLSEASLKKYRVLLQGRRKGERSSPTLEEYAADKGYLLLKQLDADVLRDFQQQWLDAPLAGRKKLERLHAFLGFACETGWVSSNPALAVKPPLLQDNPTLPLDDDEFEQIYRELSAFEAERKTAARGQAAGSDHLDRLKALLMVLEHTGLRIIDVVQLSSRQILNGRLVLRAQKNRSDINLLLPNSVTAELQVLDRFEGGCYFWTGDGKPETAAGDFRLTPRDLGEYCKVPDLHPHRFRDSVAVRLLQGGATLDRVACALGNRASGCVLKDSPFEQLVAPSGKFEAAGDT